MQSVKKGTGKSNEASDAVNDGGYFQEATEH